MATENRSGLKDFLASIATIKGDLSTITAPPFLLATQSTVQFPSYWAENPTLFVAPAKEESALKRTVLVLKWFLAALKRQQYAGRDPSAGVKKPLNAFLGEVFRARWEDEQGKTRIVSEQVSHHPPVTACYLWNEEYGVRAGGFACQSITFSGTVNIKQMGYALIHLDRWEEDYLIPLPNVKVSGLLTGTPYPEIEGRYRIVASSGYVADIDFSGKKFLGLAGKKNGFSATVHPVGKDDEVLYTAEGTWSEGFSIRDEQTGTEIETYDYDTAALPPMLTDDLDAQDPWESQRAWHDTTTVLDAGKMQAAVDAKSKIEQGQRNMRSAEEKRGEKWETIFFSKESEDPVYAKLAGMADSTGDDVKLESGFWKYKFVGKELPEKPYRGELMPDNSHTAEGSSGSRDGRAEAANGAVRAGSTGSKGEETPRAPSTASGPIEPSQSHTSNVSLKSRKSVEQNIVASPYSQQALDPRVDKPASGRKR